MTDEIGMLFGRLRGGPFSLRGVSDPGAVAYELQGGSGGSPLGHLDELDAFSTDFSAMGVYNGSFSALPSLGASTNLALVDNELPGWWNSPVSVSGSAITFQVVPEAAGGGYDLRATMVAGAAGDEAYVERVERIPHSKAYTVVPSALFYGPTALIGTAGSALAYVTAQFLQSDGVTTTGTAGTNTVSLATIDTGAGDLWNLRAYPDTSAAVPVDAAFLRSRIGLKRDAAATSAAGSVDVADFHLIKGDHFVFLTDQSDPATYLPRMIYQLGGALRVVATSPDTSTAGVPYLYLDPATPRALLVADGPSGPYVGIDSNRAMGVVVPLLLTEVAAPGTPNSGYYYLYPKTDGILYGKNDAGTETALGGGGGATVTVRTSGTANWTPDAASTAVRVLAWGAGGGGASGVCGGNGQVRAGGGGGGGGSFVDRIYQISDLTTPVSVTVGTGG